MNPNVSRRELFRRAALFSAAAAPSCRAARVPESDPDRFDSLFSDLTDQSERYEPISPDERRRRVERLALLLTEHGVDALLVEPGATLRYLSGVEWWLSERLFALVVCADGSSFFIAPAFEVPRAREIMADAGHDGPILGWDEHEYAWRPLASALAKRGVERIAIDPRARAFVVHALGEVIGPERVLPGLPIVRALRGRKDAHEIELLRGANELTQRAIGAAAEKVELGISDHELGALMRRAQERLGLTDVWVLPLIGQGAAAPHGAPVGRKLVAGDVVLVDTGGALHGYQSDITRTWVFRGTPTTEVRSAWNAVRDAQRRAFETIRPGALCRDVDRAARETTERAGFGAGYTSFAHRLGHGIGLEGHEDPYFDGGSEVVLEPGMTFSDEPGIYVPGRFGVRLEDIVLVTESGADHFGDWQAALDSPRAAHPPE